jgi:hypothetical protein
MSLCQREMASLTLAVAVLLLGCGKKGTERSTADQPESANTEAVQSEDTTVPVSVPPAAVEPSRSPLTTEDIDRWEQGMEGEITAVRQAGDRRKAAKNADDSLEALNSMNEMGTLEAGAKAAGVDPERYRYIRQRFSATVTYLTPPESEGMDTTKMPEELRAEIRQAREMALARAREEMSPEVIEALKPRALELRKKSLELVGARFKAAGM